MSNLEEEYDRLRKEFRFFIDNKMIKHMVKEDERVLVNYYHSFEADFTLPIPSEEKKWEIGATKSKKLKEIDRMLNEIVLYHRDYDFEKVLFYCYLEEGKVTFRAYLPFLE